MEYKYVSNKHCRLSVCNTEHGLLQAVYKTSAEKAVLQSMVKTVILNEAYISLPFIAATFCPTITNPWTQHKPTNKALLRLIM
jgi:hypothetical protein